MVEPPKGRTGMLHSTQLPWPTAFHFANIHMGPQAQGAE